MFRLRKTTIPSAQSRLVCFLVQVLEQEASLQLAPAQAGVLALARALSASPQSASPECLSLQERVPPILSAPRVRSALLQAVRFLLLMPSRMSRATSRLPALLRHSMSQILQPAQASRSRRPSSGDPALASALCLQ